jgi:uncharacterized OB-fold protein
MTDTPRPLPQLQGLTREFYDWCGKGELRFQRCVACEAWRHVPREMCPTCGSFEWSWNPSTGRGKVYSWTTVERPMHPAFARAAPYAVVVVEMEEGVRIASSVVDRDPRKLAIGLPVIVVFDQVVDGVTLPAFRCADA